MFFQEEFIESIMSQGKTSVVLLTGNVNKDKTKSFFKEFAKAAEENFE